MRSCRSPDEVLRYILQISVGVSKELKVWRFSNNVHDIQANRHNEVQPGRYGFGRPLYNIGLGCLANYKYPYNNEGCQQRDNAKSVACYRLAEGTLGLSLAPHIFTT
jgi:hypothetical protein